MDRLLPFESLDNLATGMNHKGEQLCYFIKSLFLPHEVV
ncbi:hypothetical protein LINPERPRIM_LOCUS27012 [Linum perenne]